MYFLIDSTTITLTRSIFSQALYSSFSLSSLNLNCHLSLFWVALYFSVCQLQYFSAHLKFAPIRGLHLQGKLSRYKREVIIWKISPFHKFPGRGCCPTQTKNFRIVAATIEIFCVIRRCTKLTMGFMTMSNTSWSLQKWHNKCISQSKCSVSTPWCSPRPGRPGVRDTCPGSTWGSRPESSVPALTDTQAPPRHPRVPRTCHRVSSGRTARSHLDWRSLRHVSGCLGHSWCRVAEWPCHVSSGAGTRGCPCPPASLRASTWPQTRYWTRARTGSHRAEDTRCWWVDPATCEKETWVWPPHLEWEQPRQKRVFVVRTEGAWWFERRKPR